MEPVTTAALIGGGASLGSGLLSSAFNLFESKKNRDFQERMSSTAHQRGVADLKAAGLNPVLSAKNAPASTPGGSQATASMPDLVNSAVAMAKTAAEIKSMEAQTALNLASAGDIGATQNPRIQLLREQKALAAGQGKSIAHLADKEGYKNQAKILRNQAMSSAYQLSQQKAESQFYEGNVGEFAPYINFLKQIIGIGRR